MNALVLVSENIHNFVQPADIQIVPTTSAHIRELNMTLRKADRQEIEMYGYTCAKGLWRSYKVGLMNKTLLVNGKVAACFGCAGTYLGKVGRPWLLTSYEVETISPLRFTRLYQKEMYKMLKVFPVLSNYVAADYEKSKRLLKIVGFTLGKPEKLGNGMYQKFTMEAA